MAVCGCGGTTLAVHARVPPAVSEAGTVVRLMPVRDPVCGDSLFLIDRTNARGRVRMQTEWCGPARVVVARRGLRPEQRVVDTCEVQAVEMRLQALREAPPVDDPAAAAAQRFLEALAREDFESVGALLADPATTEHFRGPGVRRVSVASWGEAYPWAIEVGRSQGDATQRSVRALLYYDDGCLSPWQVTLVSAGAEWRVIELQPLPPMPALTP